MNENIERKYKLFHNILEIKENINFIKSKNKSKEVKLVAVSKKKPLSDMKMLIELNHFDFGENYAQEFLDKYNNISDKANIDFIGSLQSNKLKLIVGKAKLIHSVDRKKIALEINKLAKKKNIIQDVLIQLNLTGEESKSGFKENELYSFLEEANKLDNIKIKGLMTMPFFSDNPEEVRPYFIKLRSIRDELSIKNPEIKELSMGMSNDYEVAVEEGASIVRVGSSIFGKR